MNYPEQNLNRILFVDIETACQHEDYGDLGDSLKELWMKKMRRHVSAEDYPTYEEEFASLYHDKGAIYAEFAQVICISVGFISSQDDELSFRVTTMEGSNEKEILTSFHHLLNEHYYDRFNQFMSGHNIKEFDIPFICRRSMVHDLPLPNLLKITGYKPWQIHHLLDTMEMWKFGDYKHYTSLDLLSHVLGVKTPKSEMDGSMVNQAYWDGRLADIVKYCQRDVIATAQVYMRCIGLSPFSEDDVTYVNKV